MKQTLFIFAISLFTLASPAQTTITTIAGGGSSFGDGGPAVDCRVNHPVSFAVDHSGNIYFSDRDNHRIRKISTTGIITTIAGTGIAGFSGDGGPATSAQIHSPYGIAIDGSDNIFFCDGLNNKIRKITTSGLISTIAGDGTTGDSGDGGPAILARFEGLGGLAIDKSGNLIIADVFNNKVKKINTAGIISTIAGTGSQGHSGDGGNATLAKLYNPIGLALDSTGNIYISEDWGSCVRKINTSGIISTVAGTGVLGFSGDNGPATVAGLSRASGIAVDKNGNLYIGDHNSQRIRKVDNFGIITTLAGTGIPGFNGDGSVATTQLTQPCCLALDRDANLIFSDFGADRIRKVSSTLGVGQWVAGSAAISIYPNPSNGHLFIAFPARASHVEVSVQNMLGQSVMHCSAQDVDEMKVDINASPGLYLISIISPIANHSQRVSIQ